MGWMTIWRLSICAWAGLISEVVGLGKFGLGGGGSEFGLDSASSESTRFERLQLVGFCKHLSQRDKCLSPARRAPTRSCYGYWPSNRAGRLQFLSVYFFVFAGIH